MATKRKPTPAQIAARKRFAEMARSGAFKKKARKKNPRASNPIKKFIVYTETKPGNWKQVRVTENLDIAKDLAKSNAESGYPSIVEDATGAIVYTPKVASNPIILVSDKPIASKRKANPVKRKVMKEKRPFYYVVKVGQSYDGQFLSTHYSLDDVKKIAQQKADKYGAQAKITEFHM